MDFVLLFLKFRLENFEVLFLEFFFSSKMRLISNLTMSSNTHKFEWKVIAVKEYYHSLEMGWSKTYLENGTWRRANSK